MAEGKDGGPLPVALLVLSYNGRHLLRECLSSWRKSSPAPESVLVVDNGSGDGTADMVRREFPEAELLSLPVNVAYAAGNNAGFRALKGRGHKAVFACSNDTEVDPDMLGRLWAELEARPGWGLAAPKILFHGTGRTWFLGGRISRLTGNGWHVGYGLADRPAGAPEQMPANGYLTGCGFLVRTEALESLGGFDEGIYMYAEDSDLCLRARKQGWECGVVPAARMYHKVSSTVGVNSPEQLYYGTRNSLFVIARHRIGLVPVLWPLTAAVYAAFIMGRRIARAALTLRFGSVRAILKGARDFVSGRMGKTGL
jgi:hypothetical protein